MLSLWDYSVGMMLRSEVLNRVDMLHFGVACAEHSISGNATSLRTELPSSFYSGLNRALATAKSGDEPAIAKEFSLLRQHLNSFLPEGEFDAVLTPKTFHTIFALLYVLEMFAYADSRTMCANAADATYQAMTCEEIQNVVTMSGHAVDEDQLLSIEDSLTACQKEIRFQIDLLLSMIHGNQK